MYILNISEGKFEVLYVYRIIKIINENLHTKNGLNGK